MSNPIVPPETPDETKALDEILERMLDVFSVYGLGRKETGWEIIKSEAFRALLRLIYCSGEQAGISKRKASDG